MIHTYVNHRMQIWAEWELRKQDNGLGFPKQCSYTRLAMRSGGAGYQPDFDSDAYEISNILLDIKKQDKRIYRVLHLFFGVEYRNGKPVNVMMTKDTIANDLQCHRDTVYAWLEKGSRMVLDGLMNNDALAHVR